MDALKLNEIISYYRKKQGLTQEQLAQRLGLTNQSVSKWESGQCCPDISLIPLLADIFGITIDELFGKEPPKTEYPSVLPFDVDWEDDNTIRVVVAQGKRILKTDEWEKPIEIRFPQNCNETTCQYFKLEVFGSAFCDASINGDVVDHGEIKCNEINGDIRECQGSVSCQGDINGAVNAANNLSCGGAISGAVMCGDNVSCGGAINGSVNCGDNVSCGSSIMGSVTCGGNVECWQIGGNVECQGDIIYKN